MKPKTVDEIVEEFEKETLFLEIGKGHGMQILPIEEMDRKRLTDFLRQTLHQQRKEILEEAVRRIEAGKWKGSPPADATDATWAAHNQNNAAKDEDIKILQTLQKEV